MADPKLSSRHTEKHAVCLDSAMLPLVIYDPAVNPDPFANGFLTYGQLPLFPLFVQDFPPSQISDISDVFEVAPLAQTTGSAGVSLNTSGTAFTISLATSRSPTFCLAGC